MKFQANLFRLSTVKQRPGLYFVVALLLLASQIHWAILQQDFDDIGLRIALAALLTIPITYLGVFIISLFRSAKTLSAFLQTIPLTTGVFWLGVVLFISGSIFGVLVPLYLGMCYFAFAPLFRDKENLIRLDSLFIATTVGALVAGFLYYVSYRFGVPGEYIAVTALLVIAVFNCYRYRRDILPTIGNVAFPVCFTFAILFVLYGSFTLIASMKMGAGDFPPVFFGFDTTARLLHVYELMNIVEFPPERLVTKGMAIPVYHVGSSATVAAISSITGLAVHKAMFWLVTPLVALGSFSALLLLVRSALNGMAQRFFAILIFIPWLRWGGELNGVFFHHDQTFGWDNWFFKNLFGSFIDSEYLPTSFYPESVQMEVTHFVGSFCLFLAAMLLVKREHLSVLLLSPIIIVLTAFAKMDSAFVVVGLIGIRLLASWRYFGPARFTGNVVAIGLVSLSCILFLGYGSRLNSVRGFNDGFTLLYTHLGKSLFSVSVDAGQLVSFGSFGQHVSYLHSELGYILMLSALFLLVTISTIDRDNKGRMLVFGSLAVAGVCLVSVSFIDLRVVTASLFSPVWIAIPMSCMALLGVLNKSTWRNVVIVLVISPIVMIGVVHHWRAIEDTFLVAFSPEKVSEYNDNRLLAEVMRVIPVEGSVVATDDILYRPSGGSSIPIKRQRQNSSFSALFGHQMFSTWGKTWWHTEKEREFVQRGFKLQQYYLGMNFNKEEVAFSNKTKRVAMENGWTHFLLKLEPDVERARKPDDVPLEMLFANSGWAVYKF